MLTNTEKDVLSHVIRAFKRSEDYTYRYFERGKDHYKHYRLYRDKTQFPYANSVFTPDTFTFVEDISSKIVQTLIARSPIYSVTPRHGAVAMMGTMALDGEKIARQLERALQYFIENEDFEFFLEFCDFIKNGGIFGTSYMGVYPDFDFTLTGELKYRGPRFEFVDFWDGYPDPNCRRLNARARYFIRRTLRYYEDIADLGEKGIYDKNQVKLLKNLRTSEEHDQTRRDLLQEIGIEAFVPTEPERHEILEYFSGGHCVVVGDRQVVLKDTSKMQVNPYPYPIPLVDYRYTQVPGEFFGIGIPEIVRDLQADKNMVRSQRRENVDLILNKILKVKTGSIDIDVLKFFPGAVWELDKLDDIEELDLRDVTQSAYMEEEKIDLDMENATGSYRYSRGQNPQREETATAVVRLQKAAMSRFDIVIKQSEFASMRKIANMVIMQMRAFLPQQDYERIVGEPDAGFYQIPASDISRFYDFAPVGSSITNIKEVRAQQIMQAQQMLLGVPPQIQQMEGFKVNYREVLRMGLEEALDIKNVDRLLPTVQQMPMGLPLPPGGLPSQVPPEVLLQEAMGQMGGAPPPGMPMPVPDLGGGVQ